MRRHGPAAGRCKSQQRVRGFPGHGDRHGAVAQNLISRVLARAGRSSSSTVPAWGWSLPRGSSHDCITQRVPDHSHGQFASAFPCAPAQDRTLRAFLFPSHYLFREADRRDRRNRWPLLLCRLANYAEAEEEAFRSGGILWSSFASSSCARRHNSDYSPALLLSFRGRRPGGPTASGEYSCLSIYLAVLRYSIGCKRIPLLASSRSTQRTCIPRVMRYPRFRIMFGLSNILLPGCIPRVDPSLQ